MSQETLNSILIVTTAGLTINAVLQHRRHITLTQVLGNMLLNPKRSVEIAKNVAIQMDLIHESDT